MNLNSITNKCDNELTIIDNCINLLKKSNNIETLEHVCKVSETGVSIARKYGLDVNKVKAACYLHDISALVHKSEYIDVCKEYNIPVVSVEEQLPMLLHQKVSRIIAEKVFDIEDDEILNAIECHTTLKDNPSLMDMTVFIADKLSWDQEGVPPFYDRVYKAIYEESLISACFEYIEYVMNNNMILIPHPMLLEAREYLKNNK